MKKKLVSILILMMVSCTACVTINYTDNNTKKEETPDENVTPDEKETPEVKQQKDVHVYVPDDMAESALVEVVSTSDEVNEDLLWNLLKERDVLEDSCNINSFHAEGDHLELDVNEAFGVQLRSYGTAGEKMMMHCVVNTFLDAFQAEQIQITENGETLCSGHMEYEGYLEKYE